MNNNIVIGLGCGDEGKGLVVDWLCSKDSILLVIRFSGGHQVGHTVVIEDKTHIFSNFGSGTLRGIPTYWSKYCTVEPIGLVNELELLLSKGINPLLYIDAKCPITTPMDISHNQDSEETNNHGSMGVGFGSTIEREEKHYSLIFSDLFYPNILDEKLRLIRRYYNEDMFCINKDFYESCKILINSPQIKKVYDLPEEYNYICEGSQGLLLDQNFGFFPNVTRSNTGCKNAIEILKDSDPDIYLVTRAYQTRHGNGFMTNENMPHNILDNPLESNVENKYQGKFRKSLLDVSLLEYGINKDNYIRNSDKKNLVITCLDSVINEYRFTYKGEICLCIDEDDFIKRISNILNITNVYISRSNKSENIRRFR